MEKNMDFNCGIVGCGGIAQVHAETLHRLPGVKLSACADIRPERAEAMGEKYGCRSYSSLEEMLEKEKLDALHICTPHYLHVPMAEAAIAKGLAVFTEKPPAISMEQWERFSSLEQKGFLSVCFQNRYNDSVQYCKELLASGKLGKIQGARAFVTWSRDKAYYTESGWRGSLETEGGGVLINQSIHTLDLLTQFLGRPDWTEAKISNHHLKGVIQVEDTMEAYGDFQGIPALFYATTAYCSNSPVLVELSCEKGVLRMEETRVECILNDGSWEEKDFARRETLGKDYWGSSHGRCIEDFYNRLRKGEKPPIPPSSVKDTAEWMLCIYSSAREKNGDTVLLPEIG